MRARVTVYPRREVLDPQGKAIAQALERLGFDEVEDVRAGKSFDIALETEDPAVARERLRQMCDKLLANTVVEDYAIEIFEPQAEADQDEGEDGDDGEDTEDGDDDKDSGDDDGDDGEEG